MRLLLILFLCLAYTFSSGQQFVGINVDTPSVELDIRTFDINNGSEINVGNSSNSYFLLMFSGRVDKPFALMYWKKTRPLVFGSSEENSNDFQEFMRINPNGNVGIATQNPEQSIHRFDTAHVAIKLETDTYSDTSEIILSNGNESQYTNFHLYNYSDRFRIGSRSDLNGGVFQEILTLNDDGNLTLDGSLTSQSLTGSGNRNVVANSSGWLIEEPTMNKYISIPPTAFKPAKSADVYVGSSSFVHGENGGETILVAPIYLPDDSVIREFYVNYRDNSASDNITFKLMRKSLYLSLTTLHSHTSTDTPNTTSYTSPLLGSVVDNESFVYFIELTVAPGSSWDSDNLELYSARIKVEL